MSNRGDFVYKLFRANLAEEMDKYDRNATGNAMRKLKVIDDGERITVVDATSDKYWKFINKGRKSGKMPPLARLLAWVKVKLGISDFKKAKSIAWAIRIKIGKLGAPNYPKAKQSLGLVDRARTKTFKELRPHAIKWLNEDLYASIKQKLKV